MHLEDFAELPPRGSFRARHGLGDGPLVAYLGQITPRKGVDHPVAAFADGALDPATLVIAGPARGMAAPAGVRHLDTLEGPERLGLLVDADVLVYPSTAEVFGLVPLEGLLCGAPVVVGGDCGCGELIREAGAGLLVTHGDVGQIRASIRTLLADRPAADAMVERGRRYIARNLDPARVAAAHLALYRELAR
jgi:glycosyltransferase involved in cell wall biosynthesis